MENEEALKVDPWSRTSRGVDGGATGPGSPGPRRPEIMVVKRCGQLWRENKDSHRTVTTNHQKHARTRKLDVPMGAHGPKASRTTVAVPAATLEQSSTNTFLRTVGEDIFRQTNGSLDQS